jgi:hypothetical protein
MGADGRIRCPFSSKKLKNDLRISCEVIVLKSINYDKNVTRKGKLRKKCLRGAKIIFLTNSWDIKRGFLFLAFRMVNMFGRKYFLNPETLRFERVRLSRSQRIRYILVFGMGLIALAVVLTSSGKSTWP